MNKEIFDALFKNLKVLEKKVEVTLIVGAPSVYDMMEREGKICIDLENIEKYISYRYDVETLMQILLTHEFVHICINDDYLIDKNDPYLMQLDYIIFQERFAHYISYAKFDELKDLDKKYIKSCKKLDKAVKETDINEQHNRLIELDTNDNYWDKYGAISAKLYLYMNKENIVPIYKEGYQGVSKKILSHYKQMDN